VKLISSFLSQRKFSVSDEAEIYTPRDHTSMGATRFRPVPHIVQSIYKWYATNTWCLSRSLCWWHLYICDRRLQRSLSAIETLRERWNIKINGERTQVIYFSHRLGSPVVRITFNGRNIPFVKHVNYLGVIFDKRRLHIEMNEANAFRTFIRMYSLFKSGGLNGTNIKLTHSELQRARIRHNAVTNCSYGLSPTNQITNKTPYLASSGTSTAFFKGNWSKRTTDFLKSRLDPVRPRRHVHSWTRSAWWPSTSPCASKRHHVRICTCMPTSTALHNSITHLIINYRIIVISRTKIPYSMEILFLYISDWGSRGDFPRILGRVHSP
jgi:hypothetical protein